MNILITGASGFIGSHLVPFLMSHGHNVQPLSRTNHSNYESLVTSQAKNSDAIIHLAGIAHRTGTTGTEYDRYNHQLTKSLADIAIENSIKHFILLSTAKVHGEESLEPLNSNSAFDPRDAYSESKVRAENYLASLESETIFSSVRPPVVYGKNPKANIARLIQRIQAKKLIPLPTKPNQRSFVSINNLNEALHSILSSRLKTYNAYLVDDRQPVSTEEFIFKLGASMNIEPKLMKIPNSLFSSADKILSKTLNVNTLSPMYRNFEIRCDLLERHTNWQPNEDLQAGLKSMLLQE